MSKPNKIPSPFTKLSVVVEHFIQNHGLEGKIRERSLQSHWKEIVGDTISKHTKPDGIRFGTLHVLVDSSAWLQQLTFIRSELIEKVESYVGKNVISDIVLRIEN